VTPDPAFFYFFPGHREALAALLYGVEQRKGFIAVTGEVGVGKTTILRAFLERIDQEQTKVIYLLNAKVSFDDLLRMLLQEFGADPEAENAFRRVNQLHRLLIEQFRQGQNVVLIVDEAQNMPAETLEGLRVLSNLETATDKLLQIVFCGQPEFDEKLEKPELRQLKQRIAVRAVVKPLTEAEGIRYIQHRLAMAGVPDRAIFTQGAIRQIVKEACGIPRLINILCDNALVTAFGYQDRQVKGRVAREIIADRKVRTCPPAMRWRVPAVGVAAAAVAAGVFLSGATDFGLLREAQRRPAETQRLLQAPPISASVAAPTPAALPAVPDTPTGEVAQTAAAEPAAVTGGEQEPVTRIVKPGDRLLDLVEAVYGVRDERLVPLVQRHNPPLSNSNVIRVGDILVFPPTDYQELPR
jgi:general secretion pathway protein A